MAEITINIPEELNELAKMSRINWQLVIARKLQEELEKSAKIKRVISKSKLTQKQADELAEETNTELAKIYEKLSKES
ncbi:MAG: hypothetical protein A2904_01500 [Candidatus Staskawiczbacteria bacterium RIFCSPLOWO2_01_FULL_33_9]|uniref:Antitoxin n=1 Tax=Candidatus Staskawiczbacteria bacterium RIFCSPLOWO2_01_FULL_33_9 TaxID=1802211 RepID=A0A1G2I892_9BACT|nr:MAG: hypothetical protein A2904_01500 [Candidatus Staskawiczbacteria bacterium RIFCSPLOWO2_01_FULL_33_9]